MRLPIIILALFSLLAGVPGPGAAAEGGVVKITLHERAIVAGNTIELGDVADLSDGASAELHHLKLGNTPWPGYARRISRALIRVRVASSGFDAEKCEFAGPEDCVVEVAAQEVPGREIADAARSHLEAQFQAPEGATAEVQLDNEVGSVFVAESEGRIEISPSMSGSSVPVGRTRVNVDLVRDGVRLKRVPVGFTVRLFREVAVAGCRIDRGEAIPADAVSLARRDVSNVRGACVAAAEELTGKVALCDIVAGQIITRDAIGEPGKQCAVDYRQRVTLIVECGGLRVAAVGTSLSRARVGERARARNESSGREVEGVVSAESTIRIPMEDLSRE